MNEKNIKKRNLYQEFMDFIDNIVKWICIILLGGMLFTAMLQVITRHVFPHPLSWTEELARYMMLWLIFLAASHIAKASSYIKVTFLVDKMPEGVRKILLVITKLIILVTAGYFSWNCLDVFTTTSVNEVSPAMQISMQIPRFSLVIGFILIFLQALAAGGLTLLPNEEEEENI
ncbi:MAG: TRAP transporter small permease [Lachnospiraceae bacterium]|jgi:TRAP-type C4-dicarboxylate transport system permease small subunit|nr:TRAP transporter small permease [Lachnospiraceae bacterium]